MVFRLSFMSISYWNGGKADIKTLGAGPALASSASNSSSASGVLLCCIIIIIGSGCASSAIPSHHQFGIRPWRVLGLWLLMQTGCRWRPFFLSLFFNCGLRGAGGARNVTTVGWYNLVPYVLSLVFHQMKIVDHLSFYDFKVMRRFINGRVVTQLPHTSLCEFKP